MTPQSHNNVMYYLSKLPVYNMGIHDCNTNQGYMLMWDATTAKCGSSEVASCLQ